MRNVPSSRGIFLNDDFQRMNTYNQQYSIQKNFEHNFHDFALAQDVDEAYRLLNRSYLVPLENNPITDSTRKILLNEKLERIAAEVVKGTEFNVIGIVIQVLTAIISTLWGRCRVHVKDNWNETAVLMTLQVSEPSTRKSPLINLLRVPFEEFFAIKQKESAERNLEREIQNETIQAINESQKSKIQSIIKKNQNYEIDYDEMESELEEKISFYKGKINLRKQELPPLVNCTGLIDGATSYQLGKTLAGQGESGCSISAEGGLFGSSLMKKGNFGKLFNRLHDQEAYEEVSGRGNISLKNPTLSIISFVQPTIARNFYNNNDANETGATARFMPVFHGSQYIDYEIEKTKLQSNSLDAATMVLTSNGYINYFDGETYNEAILRLLQLYFTQDADAEKFCVKLTPEAKLEVEYFHSLIQRNVIPYVSPHAKAALGKLHGKAVRLALSIHALTNRIPHEADITLESMKTACLICDYLIPHIQYACVPWGAQAYSDAIVIIDNLQAINTHVGERKILKEGIDTTKLSSRVGFKGERFDYALTRLALNNIVIILDNAEKGKRVVLHPDFFKRKLY